MRELLLDLICWCCGIGLPIASIAFGILFILSKLVLPQPLKNVSWFWLTLSPVGLALWFAIIMWVGSHLR